MPLIDLPWLPTAPDDFRKRCKALTNDAQARFLAGHALDLGQLNSLAKALATIPTETMAPLRLGLLGNATTSLLVPALIGSAARHSIRLDVIEAPYGQAVQTALDPNSALNTGAPDVILLAFDHHIIPPIDDMTDRKAAEQAVEAAIGQVDAICRGVRQACGAPAIVQTLPPPPGRLLGGYDRRLPGSLHAVTEAFNRRLTDSLESGNALLDISALSSTVGLDTWHDATQWHLAKLSFSQNAVPLYAEHATRLLAAMRGKSRRCLVLDLDNTLWGGIIGDDGLDGIVIGQGDPVGEAHLDIQRTALQLSRLGIILAVSSKNDDATARLPFRNHPDMILKENNIAVFQANWENKASNLEAIASALDIGIDSLVLLDDNPAERAQVRDALPMVAVPELPADPASFASTLLAGGYFEAFSFSDEDRLRADDYAARAKRVELQGEARDLGSFLDSLNMEISFSSFDPPSRGRISQLVNKSNQFNLTTRRYSEAQIEVMETDPALFTLQVRLKDRFGDNGMISVVICRPTEEAWEIDTWLMSCRVLGRRVEEAVLDEIVRHAKASGVQSVRGHYLQTDRNNLVRDHYRKLGFTSDSPDNDEQETWWRLDLDAHVPADPPMTVVRSFPGDPS